MPRINFNDVPEAGEFSPLPEGRYLCSVDNIEEDVTRDNDEMWKVKFRVEEGPHKGRYLFDNMVFSAKAMSRVKLICSRLGIDVSGEVDLQPNMLIGREVLIDVEIEKYTDRSNQLKERNSIPFAGYFRANGEGESAPASRSNGQQAPPPSDDDLPF